MRRPYLNLQVTDLERLFAEHSHDAAVVRQLHDELTHRTMPRARALKAKVERLLSAKAPSSAAGGTPVSPKTAPPPRSDPPEELLPYSTPNPYVPPPLQQKPYPVISDDPIAVLSAWSAVEVLSPPSFVRPEDLAGGDRTRIVAIDQGPLP